MGNCNSREPIPTNDFDYLDNFTHPPLDYKTPEMEALYQAYITARKRLELSYAVHSSKRLQQLISIPWKKKMESAAKEGYSTIKISDDCLTSNDRKIFAKKLYSLFGDGIKVYYENSALHLTWDPHNTEPYPRVCQITVKPNLILCNDHEGDDHQTKHDIQLESAVDI